MKFTPVYRKDALLLGAETTQDGHNLETQSLETQQSVLIGGQQVTLSGAQYND